MESTYVATIVWGPPELREWLQQGVGLGPLAPDGALGRRGWTNYCTSETPGEAGAQEMEAYAADLRAAYKGKGPAQLREPPVRWAFDALMREVPQGVQQSWAEVRA